MSELLRHVIVNAYWSRTIGSFHVYDVFDQAFLRHPSPCAVAVAPRLRRFRPRIPSSYVAVWSLLSGLTVVASVTLNWLRWRPFISRICRHCTTLASSSNIPYCIVLLTDIWTNVFCVNHHHRHHRVCTTLFLILHLYVYYWYFEPYRTPSLNTRHT